jgi:hypothetical protein
MRADRTAAVCWYGYKKFIDFSAQPLVMVIDWGARTLKFFQRPFSYGCRWATESGGNQWTASLRWESAVSRKLAPIRKLFKLVQERRLTFQDLTPRVLYARPDPGIGDRC